MTERPNPVDVHVGAVVRRIRKEKGVSQETLAAGLGITFQQVQKYENGSNRISASKLYAISVFLNTPVSAFYEGVAETGSGCPQPADHDADGAVGHAGKAPLEERLARLPPKRRELAYQMLEHFLEGDDAAAAQAGRQSSGEGPH